MQKNEFRIPEDMRLMPASFLRFMKAAERSRMVGAEVDHDYWINWARDYIARKAVAEK